ncbi:PMD domain-containing protein [Psidium guajava]|nr:PMD domain-containing protein [Psidium guajava]
MKNKPIFIVEERKEFLLSPNGDAHPALRTGHFLKPSSTDATEPVPPPPLFSTTLPPENLLISVNFDNWRHPTESWTTWVDSMESAHGLTWKRAGIYDAIKCSTFLIRKHPSLVLGLAQYWCPDTNTFVFPWGEATITLEDVMVLGGYSAWGSSPLLTYLRDHSGEVEMELRRAMSEISKTTAKKADSSKWMEKFRDTESDIEHEAFLAYWLSTFAFPRSGKVIYKAVLPMAIGLARGARIAFAPAVLARIYRKLSRLKNVLDGNEADTCIRESAPFALVQVWAWERFATAIRPNPREVQPGEPRLGRWHKSTKLNLENVHSLIGEAGVQFKWRPYSLAVNNLPSYAFYGEKEKWVSLEEDAGGELRSFARCLMTRELPGLSFVEKYSPHRVAMQFGMDQDMRGRVAPCNQDPEKAWDNYSKSLQDVRLYVAARIYEPCVTARYAEWWASRSSSGSMQGLIGRPGVHDDLVPLGFQPKRMSVDMGDFSQTDDGLTLGELLRSKRRRSVDMDDLVSPGFQQKRIDVDRGDSSQNDDGITLGELLRSKRRRRAEKNCSGIDQTRSSSIQNAENTDIETRGSPMKPVETNRPHDDTAAGGAQRDNEAGTKGLGQRFTEGGLAGENVGESSACLMIETLVLELEARMSKLERALAERKGRITK